MNAASPGPPPREMNAALPGLASGDARCPPPAPPAGDDSAMGELILLRHGETEWSRDGRHTGLTDVPLTPPGEAAAAALAPVLAGRDIRAVFASPLQRAVLTAGLAGLADVKQDPDLREWDYGG